MNLFLKQNLNLEVKVVNDEFERAEALSEIIRLDKNRYDSSTEN